MLLLKPCIYQCIFHLLMFMWIICPYGASICGNEVLFVAEVVHFSHEMMLEMACVQGEHYFLFFTSAIHFWHYDSLGGVLGVPHAML